MIYSMNNALFFFLNNTLNKRYNLNISYNLSIIDTIALIFEDADTEFALTLVLLDVSQKTDLFLKSVLTLMI